VRHLKRFGYIRCNITLSLAARRSNRGICYGDVAGSILAITASIVTKRLNLS